MLINQLVALTLPFNLISSSAHGLKPVQQIGVRIEDSEQILITLWLVLPFPHAIQTQRLIHPDHLVENTACTKRTPSHTWGTHAAAHSMIGGFKSSWSTMLRSSVYSNSGGTDPKPEPTHALNRWSKSSTAFFPNFSVSWSFSIGSRLDF